MGLRVACIADDLTGAADIAATLSARGFSTRLLLGPGPWDDTSGAEAVVVALKTRTVEPEVAVAESVSVMTRLGALGARAFIFKYCSTFDSTPEGNIGPVAQALLDQVDQSLLTYCPSFPANGRTVVDGQLLVGGVPLDQTSMRAHPLTPMLSADVADLLRPQVRGDVSSVHLDDVRAGPLALHARLHELAATGVRHVIVDAETDEDIVTLGEATSDLALVTGASAVALGYPQAAPPPGRERVSWPLGTGPVLVVAGSCSAATLRQIETFISRYPAHRIDVGRLLEGADEVGLAVGWAGAQDPDAPLLVYSSQAVEDRAVAPALLDTATRIEDALAEIADQLVRVRGVSKLIVAGGETSGAVARRLGITSVEIGPLIAAGVPWTLWRGERDVAVAFKSGNFGSDDFFVHAPEVLAR